MKWYKNIWLWISVVLIIAFIVIPLCSGYSLGFVNGVSFSFEEPYYLLSVAVAIAVAVFTYKIYKKQLDLMEEQKNISKAQTEIAEKQTKIMEQQNKIALFEKRYEAYKFSCEFLYTVVKVEMILEDDMDNKSMMRRMAEIFYPLLNIPISRNLKKDDVSKYITEYYIRIKHEIEKIRFLYNEEIAIHFENLLEIIMKLFEGDFNKNNIQELSLFSQKFSDYGIETMEQQLKL